jgi:hypothetical protein
VKKSRAALIDATDHADASRAARKLVEQRGNQIQAELEMLDISFSKALQDVIASEPTIYRLIEQFEAAKLKLHHCLQAGDALSAASATPEAIRTFNMVYWRGHLPSEPCEMTIRLRDWIETLKTNPDVTVDLD